MHLRAFYILLSLAERDRHGSGIMRDVLLLSNGEVHLWPVTLYGTLDELVEQGLLRALDHPPADTPAEESGHRRWFRLTAAGRKALSGEANRMASVARMAQARVATRRGMHP